MNRPSFSLVQLVSFRPHFLVRLAFSATVFYLPLNFEFLFWSNLTGVLSDWHGAHFYWDLVFHPCSLAQVFVVYTKHVRVLADQHLQGSFLLAVLTPSFASFLELLHMGREIGSSFRSRFWVHVLCLYVRLVHNCI